MEQKTPVDWKKAGRIAIICVAAALVLLTVLTCLYTVDDKQQAVVTTFGKVTDVTDAGLHVKLPFGIQQVRNVVGSTSVDAVLTDGKENVQMQVKDLVTDILAEYDIGLTLVDVRIQDSEPPTKDVIEAFKAVETAKQKAETVVNDAKAYENAQLPDAQAQADKLLQNAEYLKQKRINEAHEQVAMFKAMYDEYAQNPQITRSRMYYEAISQILPDVKILVNTGDGSDMNVLLPLESLTGGN